MFGETHDAILLIIAALYVVVGLARIKLTATDGLERYAGTSFTIAGILAVVAVLW